MSVPYLAIAVFSGFLLLVALIRLAQALMERESRCDVGCSKTIGSREVQEDFYRVIRGREGLLAVLADGMGKELEERLLPGRSQKYLRISFRNITHWIIPFIFSAKHFRRQTEKC